MQGLVEIHRKSTELFIAKSEEHRNALHVGHLKLIIKSRHTAPSSPLEQDVRLAFRAQTLKDFDHEEREICGIKSSKCPWDWVSTVAGLQDYPESPTESFRVSFVSE